MALIRARVIIEGRVQGVYFRQNILERARELKLTGWVKNRYDGAVEVLAEGEEMVVKELVEYCHRGPRAAVVNKIRVDWEEYKGEFDRFGIAWG